MSGRCRDIFTWGSLEMGEGLEDIGIFLLGIPGSAYSCDSKSILEFQCRIILYLLPALPPILISCLYQWTGDQEPAMCFLLFWATEVEFWH